MRWTHIQTSRATAEDDLGEVDGRWMSERSPCGTRGRSDIRRLGILGLRQIHEATVGDIYRCAAIWNVLTREGPIISISNLLTIEPRFVGDNETVRVNGSPDAISSADDHAPRYGVG